MRFITSDCKTWMRHAVSGYLFYRKSGCGSQHQTVIPGCGSQHKIVMCRCGSHPQRVKISRHQFSRISAKINQKKAASFVKSAVSPSANSARGKAKNIISFAKSGGGQSAMSAARIANSGRQGENP